MREEKFVATSGCVPYFSYIPRSTSHTTRQKLLIAVHGISRNAVELIAQFAPYAEQHGYTVIAPLFDAEMFGDYQRLGRMGRGRRADRALDAAIDSFSRKNEIAFDRRVLFGFSGGGQFVHRYAMAYPDRVNAVVVAAAGWYTAPDSQRRYPKGLRVGGLLPGIRIEPKRFLRVPILTVVGDRDVRRDDSVRLSRWLDREQGRSRIERARKWTQMMRDAAERLGIDGQHEFAELRGAGHSFLECMKAGLAERVFDFTARCETQNAVGREIE